MLLNQDIQARCDLAYEHWNAGRAEEARALFAFVVAVDPQNLGALEGLGLVAVSQGQPDVARGFLERVLQIAPGRVETQLNLADILHRSGQLLEAKTLLEQVIARRPDFHPSYFLLGQILWALGEIEAAFDSFSKARLDLAPDLLGYLEYLCHHRLGDADWRGYDAQKAFFRNRLRAGADTWQPTLQMLTSNSTADICKTLRIYSANHFPPQPPLWKGERWRHDRIRIGYLTAEIYDHPVANLMAGVLEHIDHRVFEMVGFSFGPPGDDKIRDRIIPTFDSFHELAGLDDAAIARLVFEREIDIAVTLNGQSYNARPGILAFRPAPVQVNYQGFPGTMGAPYVDYLVADRHVIPTGDMAHYTEKIAWMPDTYQPTDDKAPISARAPSRAEERLPQSAFVFMAYNHANKITPAMFDVWARILRRVEGAALWLPIGEPASADNLRREATARGLDPSRLVFARRLAERPDHIARHRLADLFLDTLPYNAHSTASDALWAGLPVLTCRGATFPGRVCAGLLTVAGLPELITENLTDYENLAVALAGDPGRLAALRTKVETEVRQTPLFDTERYTRNLETAFRTMHEIHQAGQRPRSFAVSPGG